MKDNDDDYKANEVQEKKIPDEKTPNGEVEVDQSKMPKRIGEPLELDCDVYAWSYLGSYDPNFISIQLFLADYKELEKDRIKEKEEDLKNA